MKHHSCGEEITLPTYEWLAAHLDERNVLGGARSGVERGAAGSEGKNHCLLDRALRHLRQLPGDGAGTGALSPITAAGRTAPPWQERLVTAGFLTVGLCIIAASLLALWGLRMKAEAMSAS